MELVIYSNAEGVPGDDDYHIDPYLIETSRRSLVHQGVLPSADTDPTVLGSRLVLDIATAHRDRIMETIRGCRPT